MPLNELAAHRPPVRAYHERKLNPWLPMASAFRRATEECEVPPLDIGVQAIPALAVSLRRCRATAYTSSAVPRFTDMLLSPRPFGSRLVVRLGVICPELRPTLLAILSVRDTAHAFPSRGSLGYESLSWAPSAVNEAVQGQIDGNRQSNRRVDLPPETRVGAATTAAPALFVEASLHLHLNHARQRVTRLLHHRVYDLRANTHK
jgi:hypothetical protein